MTRVRLEWETRVGLDSLEWDSSGRLEWDSGRLEWDSSGRLEWDSGRLEWDSSGRLEWDKLVDWLVLTHFADGGRTARDGLDGTRWGLDGD